MFYVVRKSIKGITLFVANTIYLSPVCDAALQKLNVRGTTALMNDNNLSCCELDADWGLAFALTVAWLWPLHSDLAFTVVIGMDQYTGNLTSW